MQIALFVLTPWCSSPCSAVVCSSKSHDDSSSKFLDVFPTTNDYALSEVFPENYEKNMFPASKGK